MVEELDNIAYELFGVSYYELGQFGKWEVDDLYRQNKKDGRLQKGVSEDSSRKVPQRK
jgi:hypothetical protein